ncbi:GNAT family N-acetyltransferase [Streptomyces sp. LN699]|uniref:GNAT family N-acetyltransferase n=1 Tax=Streptomyces sp. LN699 TaxID=3112981 RepID=UPI003717120D
MSAVIEQAAPTDIADLRQLYYAVYGPHYPTALGTDPAEMSRLIRDPHTLWLVARCPRTGALAGSAAIHGEAGTRIGRLEGLAVHPDQRGSGLAGRLTEALCSATLDAGTLDSVYATVRTVSAGPQRVVARHGFRPLGILPNAVDLGSRESLALYARHSPGVLDRRVPVAEVPALLAPLLRTAGASLGISYADARPTAPTPLPAGPAAAPLEVIEAPAFVRRRFHAHFPDGGRWFYPLHTPNILLTPADGDFEVYAYLNRTGGYCALVAAHPDPAAAARVAGAGHPYPHPRRGRLRRGPRAPRTPRRAVRLRRPGLHRRGRVPGHAPGRGRLPRLRGDVPHHRAHRLPRRGRRPAAPTLPRFLCVGLGVGASALT